MTTPGEIPRRGPRCAAYCLVFDRLGWIGERLAFGEPPRRPQFCFQADPAAPAQCHAGALAAAIGGMREQYATRPARPRTRLTIAYHC
jgi:hypothetical protein